MAGAIIAPIMQSQGRNVNDTLCQSNLRTIAQASMMYASENDDRFPIEGWDRTLQKFQDDPLVFACPVQRRMDPRTSGYSFSKELAGKEKPKIEAPETKVLVFDSQVTKPGAVGNPAEMARPARHGNAKSNNLVYADGHVESVD